MTEPTTEQLDEMTKEQLLELAVELGVSPANQGMSKGDLRAAVDDALGTGGDEPTIGLQVTTTSTKDYLNRSLVNPTPGTSNATDYLGRAVVSGNKDHLGRSLVA